MRILVIDDKDYYVNECCGLLEDKKYETIKAYSIKDAEDILCKKGDNINIALIDMFMQNDSHAGLKLVRLIRNRYPQIVPIVVTGNGNQENAAECMREGAFFYIIKDQTPPELLFQTINLAIYHYKVTDYQNRINEGIINLDRKMTSVFDTMENLIRLKEEHSLLQKDILPSSEEKVI